MISECEEYNEEYGYPSCAREAHIIWDELYTYYRRKKIFEGDKK